MSATARRVDEELLASVFAEVLGCPQIGREDDFFALSGASHPARRQLAVRLAAQLRERLGLDIPQAALLARPTVAGLADWIGAARPGAVIPPIERAGPHPELPLSYGQRRLWFLDQLEPGSAAYNVPFVLELSGPLDTAALQASLHAIERRHEILRTRFGARDGQPFQRAVPCGDAPLPVIDLSSDLFASPPERRATLAMRLAEEESRQPFDLAAGPLWRSRLLRLDGTHHLLVLTLHHIVCDGWSIEVLLRELGACYEALAAGGTGPVLPALPIQYGDYALWQHRHFDRDALSAPLDLWKRRLAGHVSVLDLAVDRTPPAMRSAAGASVSIELPARLLEAAKEYSRRRGGTLFMTLLAVFENLLSRYTGRGRFLVGTPVANRQRTELKGLIGFFANTLVLPATVSPEASFGVLLAHVREVSIAALSHQDLPLEMLVQELAPDRNQSRLPLLQAMFTFHNAPTAVPAIPGLALRLIEVNADGAMFDLVLAGLEVRSGLRVQLGYSTELLSPAAAQRFLGHFATLLASAVADPEQRIDALPLLTEAERSQLLVEWNDTSHADAETALHAAFERQAGQHPDLPAVVYAGQVLTYRELDRQAGRLARCLRAQGVGPEVPVALYLERSAAVVVAILGVLKAGGAYLPLDTQYPAERLAAMLEDAGRPLLVTERRLAGSVTGAAREILWLDDLPVAGEALPAAGHVDAAGLAYVLYTSGSTGKPKGVACTHRGALNLLADFARRQPLAPGCRGSVWTSLSFDVSVYEIFSPLLAGGAVVLAPDAVRQETERFLDWLIEERIDSAYVPPFMLAALCDRLEQAGGGVRLRRLLVGVEPIPEPLLVRIAQLCPGLAVINGYGPTEATICATLYGIDPRRDRFGSPPLTPIGRPAAGAGAYLLDSRQQPVPLGVPGELYIAGEGLARGYLGRPEATAERFVPHPWSAAGGERLYRTGDLVRRRPDGILEFLGRVDRQIKLRGFRIEPGEIEAALLAHPSVHDAVVTVSKPAGGSPLEGREHRRLLAYAVAAGGHDLTGGELREFLRPRLPSHMVPDACVVLRAWPLTPAGKRDRAALPQPEAEAALEGAEAPRTPVEELLAGIWEKVLGVERVGLGQSFFELGGHSLLATQVAARVRSLLGVELPLRALFEAPTVAGLAAQITAAQGAERTAQVPPPARTARPEALPLSFGQERLWFLQQLEPGSATYNMPAQVELSGALRAGVLVAALTELVRRHESLRTLFVAAGGVPQQRIAPPPSAFPLPLVDLSALPAPAGGSEAERLALEQAGMGFDLEQGPLFAAFLARLSEERHRLLLNMHHIISDGWSTGVLFRDLGTLYAAFLEQRPSPLPELPIQYADFAVWQRAWLAARRAEELAYWEARLGGEIAPVELPSDRPRPAVQTFRGGHRQLDLTPELTARLKSFGRAEGATLFMALLAAMQALLARHSGEHDVPVGAPVAGRRWSETEGLIGFFLNTLVLRTDLSGSPSFRELVARVRTVTLEAYSHQDVPFEAVLNRLRLDRDLSRAPLFQVLFNMLNLPRPELSLPGLDLRILAPAEAPSKFDATFYLAEAGGGVRIDLVYNVDLFDEARMVDLLAQLEALLAQALERPDAPVDHLSLVTAVSRPLLPDPTAPLDGGWIGGVHELFADQAGRAPERCAVAGIDGVWSYGDLLAGCRGVAGWLAANGVRPGDTVAILAHRSAPLVQAVLGVLTAAAAFAVLDPAYPPQRQVEMLRLAAPRAWIALEAAGPVSGAVRRWLDEAGCACLELPAGGRASLESVATFSAGATRVLVDPDDVACIGFTSGSTGGPKGILGRHGPLSHFLPHHCQTFELGPDDRFSLLSGLAHDPLQRDLFTPLFLGAAIVIPDPADFGVAGRWAAWMRRESVTVAHLTPALGQLLTERPPGGEPMLVPSLRRVFLVGESLTRQDVARLHAMAPGVTCVNLYGSTETQRAVGFHRVTREEAAAAPEGARQVLPLGCGVQDVQLLVINRAEELAGIGELGEIAVRSPHLARGYLGQDELTAERFQANPFTGEVEDRIYRTGDLGRYLPDGEVAFAGRADFQVKLRGFRIELGEIEAVLASHPAVREVVVLLRTDLPSGSGLVAYVVADGPEDVRPLRGWLEERLPGYMVPAAFVSLDSLPRTPNGKIDRRALERRAPETEPQANVLVAPRTPTEELLAGIWAEVLGLERVGMEEKFFELGGHSLLATPLVSRIRELFRVELELRAVFEAPTVAGLAERILARQRLSGEMEAPPIRPVPRQEGLPLSFAQQRLWFLEQMDPGNTAYTMSQGLRLEGALEVASLEGALREVGRRHEALRTRFVVRRDEPCQVIDPPRPWRLPRVDLGGLEAGAAERERRGLTAAVAGMPFDLARGPLWRALLIHLSAREHVLLLTQHHIVSDGWSMRILAREVAALYTALRTGRPSPLPELPVQYADFSVWQRRWLQGEVLQNQLDYWQRQLGGMPPALELPTDRPRPARGNRSGLARHRFATPLRELRTLSRRHDVTLFMLLMAAFQVLLRRLVRRDDIVVGTDIANRDQLAIEGALGFFVNQLAIRSDLSGNPTFRDLLTRVREVTLGAYAHQQLPFDKLVEALQPERSSTQAPIFQVKCNLLNFPLESPEELPGLVLRPLENLPAPGQLDWLLSLGESGDDLLAVLHYKADLFEAATVRHALALLDRLLAAAVAHPASTLAELDGVLAQADDEERERRESEVEQSSLKKLQKVQRRSMRIS